MLCEKCGASQDVPQTPEIPEAFQRLPKELKEGLKAPGPGKGERRRSSCKYWFDWKSRWLVILAVGFCGVFWLMILALMDLQKEMS